MKFLLEYLTLQPDIVYIPTMFTKIVDKSDN